MRFINREPGPARSESAYTRGTASIVNDTRGNDFEARPKSNDDALPSRDKRVLFTQLPTGRIFGITTRSEMAEKENVVIEPATEADLDELSEMLGELFSQESDFRPDKDKQLRGLRLIFEQPSRGRVFVLRRNGAIVGMINLLFTISTAEGGFVILLEDLVVHDSFRGHGYGSQLLEYAINFAKQKKFLRITLLTDRPELRSQNFFKRHGFYESPMLPMRLLISSDAPAEVTL